MTETPFLSSLSATEIFGNDRGLNLEAMIRAIFLDKINVVNAQQSNILVPRMISDSDDVDYDTGFSSSNVYNESYPLIVIEMQRSVQDMYGTKMESLAVDSLYDLYDLTKSLTVIQVSDKFRSYAKQSREMAGEIASEFYPPGAQIEVADHFLIDLLHTGARQRHVVSARICDDTQAVDICSHGKCRLDLKARLHYRNTKVEDKQEKDDLARKILKVANRVNVADNFGRALSIASAYRPLLLAHVFVPVSV